MVCERGLELPLWLIGVLVRFSPIFLEATVIGDYAPLIMMIFVPFLFLPTLMIQLAFPFQFAIFSAGLIYVSRASLRKPGSHGFYRFFAWEAILALFLLSMDIWFRDPFSNHQLISWFLLLVCILPLVFGIRGLATKGHPADRREEDGHLLAFEKTTTLVTTGIYRYIRHPLYCSLLLLAWGIFFKAPAGSAIPLVLVATLLLVTTAKADEAECIRYFGSPYLAYMKETKMFLPFLL